MHTEKDFLGPDFREEKNQKPLLAALKRAQEIVIESEGLARLNPEMAAILMGLLQTINVSYSNLLSGSQREAISFCAWCVRNLIECEIWMEYVTKSQDNAVRFLQDRINDAIEVLSVSATYDGEVDVEFLKKHSPYADLDFNGATVAAAQKVLAELKAAESLIDEEYLRVSKIAKVLGHKEWFSVHNKILSKFVHPTAYSVLSSPSEKSRTNISVYLLDSGCKSCFRSISTLNDYLKANGLPVIVG